MIKVITIIGTRPQFIKSAVLTRKIKTKKWSYRFEEIIIHTGQHYDNNMSEIFFKEMEIPKPDYNLEIGSGNHGEMTGKMLIGIEKLLIQIKPDIVLVYGDTNSTLAGALAASKLNIPVAHIEAGLRSYWKKMPEEQNRILTDQISDFLFCPTESAIINLKKEGIDKGLLLVGDIMYDAYIYYSDKIKMEKKTRFKKILINNNINLDEKNNFYLLTIHRAENADNPERLKNIVESLNTFNQSAIYPIHPRTRKKLNEFGLKFLSHINLINPVGYFDMLTLQTFCKFVVTDSGGMQKEAYFAYKPCITLRDQTEWIETVESGWNKIVGANIENILFALNQLKDTPFHNNIFGDGNSSDRILENLLIK